MSKFELMQVLTGFIGSLGFAITFNIRGKRLAFAALGGFMSWFMFVILNHLISNEPINYFIVALTVSFYAEVMARILKTPTTTFVTTSLIPLIPGGSLYYTMVYAFQNNNDLFLDKGIYTLELASSLALGIITATALTRTLHKNILFFKFACNNKNDIVK